MAQLYVKYNPYKMETKIKVNGNEISTDSMLFGLVKGKRLQEWVGRFPEILKEELNTLDFEIDFYGMPLDYDDFEDSFNQAKKKGIINKLKLNLIEGKSDEDINVKIEEIFNDLQNGPVDDFRDPKLIKAFKNVNNTIFPINVIATMSSGKSTLINALLGKRLMPSKNEACTATITEILDNDKDQFTAVVYNEANVKIASTDNLTYEEMDKLNSNEDVHLISAQGDIPFLDANDTSLMLVDTPGPNNSQNQAHKNTTYRAINGDSNNLILYVLNGTQLSTTDDASLLQYVANQIKKGGKQVRDRFIFVINKMDGFNPEEENIEEAIEKARNYLAGYGIEDPQIFPCSAYTALNIRTYFKDIDIDNLTRAEERKLPQAARDSINPIYKFIEFENMHLEKYSNLSPSAQRELEFKLKEAEKNEDTKELALIHSGIYSIEAAITAYVKKYAKTKKVKDLVETFQEVIESTQVITKAKTQVATDEKAARACAERAASVKAKIADGKEAEKFKQKIEKLDPMESIKNKAEILQAQAAGKTSIVFEGYGDVIEDRNMAKQLVSTFTNMSSNAIAELTSELESAINEEVRETGEKILEQYKEKLTKFDDESSSKELDFDTLDLIKGALSNMKESTEAWKTDDFATETVDDLGEVTVEEKVYYEKVGQEEEEIADGVEKVKVGTRKVKSGSHKEWVGTKSVRNWARKFWQIWKPRYVDEDVYETVDDYKDEDVYEDRIKYKTVMRDIFEERHESIEKFSVETSVIQSGLISKLRRSLDEGIGDALEYAEDLVEEMKEQFYDIFDELDKLIEQKYTELEECASDQATKEKELERNKKLLDWIEACRDEINTVLEI